MSVEFARLLLGVFLLLAIPLAIFAGYMLWTSRKNGGLSGIGIPCVPPPPPPRKKK